MSLTWVRRLHATSNTTSNPLKIKHTGAVEPIGVLFIYYACYILQLLRDGEKLKNLTVSKKKLRRKQLAKSNFLESQH